MSFTGRLLFFSIVPLIAIFVFQGLHPNAIENAIDALQTYFHNTFPINPSPPASLPRSETPLIISAVTHWSHYEKIAKIAVRLAELGYPITFITGSIFANETASLHPDITFYAMQGGADKMTEEEYATYASLPAGSDEAAVFVQKVVLVGGMQPAHDTLQKVFSDFREQYGDEKPLLSFYDAPVVGHLPVLLGAPGIKPDTTFGISCHPIIMDSEDTYPFQLGKVPETGPGAKEVHRRAYEERQDDYKTREVDVAWWAKLGEMGAVRETYPTILHAMGALPDHFFTMGVPEFEWPRADLRENVHYFGALKKASSESSQDEDLPSWWDEVLEAKSKGKKIVAISQGTVAADLNDLLLPALEALKDCDDILVIASTVIMQPEEMPGLVLPKNARATKFVPYDLLLPLTDVLINNGGYGAVMTALTHGVPMVVAGTGEDKVNTNNLVQWSGVGINLGTRTPEVEAIRDAVGKVLDKRQFREHAVAMSRNFDRYDLSTVFDEVIQGVVKDWARKRG